MSAADEALVRALLQAMTDGDVEAARPLVHDDVELASPNVPSANGFDELTKGWHVKYEHLDDVHFLIGAEEEPDGVLALVGRELHWREAAEPAVRRTSTIRYGVRDGRISRIEVLEREPWERV